MSDTLTPVDRVKHAERTVAELTERYNKLVDEHNTLARSNNLTDGQVTRYNDLGRAMEKLGDEVRQAEQDLDNARFAVRRSNDLNRYANYAGNVGTEDGGLSLHTPTPDGRVWEADIARMSPADLVGVASRAVEVAHRTTDGLADVGFERAEELLRSADPVESQRAAQWAFATSDPLYRTAFLKLATDPNRGHLEWTREEQSAFARVQNVARAMSLTDANGGFMVPFTLDPSIMLTNAGNINPIRELARNVTTTTDTWNGITSAGATAEWKTEADEAADGSPTLAQPSIPTFLADVFVPASFEVYDDWTNTEEVVRVMSDAADNLLAVAYTTGNGTSAPQGIVTGLAGTASEINTQGSEALAATDPFDLQNALPARFSGNATWQAHISTMNTYRQFETSNGALQFPELRDNPPYLLGKRFYENSNMDSSINAAATANNYMMVYGSIRDAYIVVNRIGTRVEFIPNLLGANGRPTGQRGMLLWGRWGGEVVNIAAARLLDVPTTA